MVEVFAFNFPQFFQMRFFERLAFIFFDLTENRKDLAEGYDFPCQHARYGQNSPLVIRQQNGKDDWMRVRKISAWGIC